MWRVKASEQRMPDIRCFHNGNPLFQNRENSVGNTPVSSVHRVNPGEDEPGTLLNLSDDDIVQ